MSENSRFEHSDIYLARKLSERSYVSTIPQGDHSFWRVRTMKVCKTTQRSFLSALNYLEFPYIVTPRSAKLRLNFHGCIWRCVLEPDSLITCTLIAWARNLLHEAVLSPPLRCWSVGKSVNDRDIMLLYRIQTVLYCTYWDRTPDV
jgi:hypothetical protein